MKAIEMDDYGGPAVLQLRDIADPDTRAARSCSTCAEAVGDRSMRDRVPVPARADLSLRDGLAYSRTTDAGKQ